MSKTFSALVGIAAMSVLGCGFVVRPGLANAPSLESFRRSDADSHDVIANGNDSCERSPTAGGGPLAHRLPPCPTRTVAVSIDPAPPWTPMIAPLAPMPCALHLDTPWERSTDDVTCCARACPATLASCPERC